MNMKCTISRIFYWSILFLLVYLYYLIYLIWSIFTILSILFGLSLLSFPSYYLYYLLPVDTKSNLLPYVESFTGTSTQLPLTKSYLSSILFKYIMNTWQSFWDSSLNGRFTYKFLPKVSVTHLYDNYFLNLFLTNRGPFPSFLQYIGKIDSPNCVGSKYGDAEHYTFEYPLTVCYHFSKPSASNEMLWFSNVLKYNSNIYKICRLIKWLLYNESFIQSI